MGEEQNNLVGGLEGRARFLHGPRTAHILSRQRDEALARIAALEAVLRECDRAVKPFANVADYAPAEIGKADVVVAVYRDDSRWTIHLGMDEFRAARTLAAKITTTLAAAPSSE